MSKFDRYNSGAPFMNGRIKHDIKELYGTPVHVDEHAYLQGANGEFAVFTLQGDDSAFFFANSVITELFKRIDSDGLDLREAEIIFSSKKSKNWGTDYTTYTIS